MVSIILFIVIIIVSKLLSGRIEKFHENVFFKYVSDPRIPTDHKVTLHFSDTNQTNDNRSLYFQSPLVKLEPLNAVAKYNSLEAFDDGEYIFNFI